MTVSRRSMRSRPGELRRNIWTLAAAILAILVSVAACGHFQTASDESEIVSELARRPPGTVDLATVIPGQWDRLVVISAYVDAGTIDAGLCLHWEGAQAMADALEGDGRVAIALVEGDQVAGWYVLNATPRGLPGVEFKGADPLVVTRDNARFSLSSSGGLLVLEPLQPHYPPPC